jgi:hypothetical protein
MDLDELLSRASNSPNADVDCFVAGDDLSAVAGLAASVDDVKTIRTPTDPGIGAPGSRPAPYLGYAMNAPTPGFPALIRVAGMARCVYGDTIEVGDLLTFDPTTGKIIPLGASFGHQHDGAIRTVTHFVYVVGGDNLPATGIDPADFETPLQWDNAGSLANGSEVVTVAELGDGIYSVAYTPSLAGLIFRLRVFCNPGGSGYVPVTPSEFQDMGVATYGQVAQSSVAQIVGIALEAGADGDRGLVLMRPQIL